jgi:hypothetical protein
MTEHSVAAACWAKLSRAYGAEFLSIKSTGNTEPGCRSRESNHFPIPAL